MSGQDSTIWENASKRQSPPRHNDSPVRGHAACGTISAHSASTDHHGSLCGSLWQTTMAHSLWLTISTTNPMGSQVVSSPWAQQRERSPNSNSPNLGGSIRRGGPKRSRGGGWWGSIGADRFICLALRAMAFRSIFSSSGNSRHKDSPTFVSISWTRQHSKS